MLPDRHQRIEPGTYARGGTGRALPHHPIDHCIRAEIGRTNHPTVASLLSEPDALLIKDELPCRIAHRRTVSRPPGFLARQMNAFVVGRLDKELIQHLLCF